MDGEDDYDEEFEPIPGEADDDTDPSSLFPDPSFDLPDDDSEEPWSEDEKDELWSDPDGPEARRADLCFYAAWGIVLLLGAARLFSPPDGLFRPFTFWLFVAAPVVGALLGLSAGYRRGRKLARATAGLLLGGFAAGGFAYIYYVILTLLGVDI